MVDNAIFSDNIILLVHGYDIVGAELMIIITCSFLCI